MRPGGLGGRLFVWFQYLLPQHGLSRLVLSATRVRTLWFKNCLIRGFLKLYRVDMTEAAENRPVPLCQLQRVLHAPAQDWRTPDRPRG